LHSLLYGPVYEYIVDFNSKNTLLRYYCQGEKKEMASSTNPSLTFIGQQITIYGGILILAVGVLGESLNIIVFLSLKTFRESSCAFYLTVMAFVNIGQLLLGLLSRIMISGFGIDWTAMSLPFCKIRLTVFHLCGLMSYTCICLATIDQYLATCIRPHWQQWSNIRMAHRLVIIFTIIWSLHTIPYFIFLNRVTSQATNYRQRLLYHSQWNHGTI
jgi:hypothetical protein